MDYTAAEVFGASMALDIAQLLAFAVKNNASDLHLSAGVPPMIRVDGDVKRVNMPALSHKEVHSMVYDIMNDKQRKAYEEFFETDFSFEIPKLARFRVNAFNQNRGAGAVFRSIPSNIVNLDDLGAPKVFRDLCMLPRGLVLVTGPTGSGKSTTLAGMIDHCNDNRPDHILTIEDPIEFVHESKRCLINQREVHRDTLGFSEALRSALREDPDVILVGEMRDLETIRLALTAAETGHLVFGTLHTSSAAKTIDRVVDVFPAAEKEMVRSMLSESLRAVISQTLLKKIGGGRVAAHEIMIGTPAIRNLIAKADRADVFGHPDRPCAGHADAGPVPGRDGAEGRRQQGRGPLQGSEQGRAVSTALTPASYGPRTGNQAHPGSPAPRVRAQGVGPVHYGGLSAGREDRRRNPPADRARPHRRAVGDAGARHHERPQSKESTPPRNAISRFAPPGIGRFRVSAFMQQGHAGCVIRLINPTIPSFEELDLPPVLKDVVLSKRGLVDHRRRHRVGQIHHAGRDGGLSQREDPRPHRDHRGSGGVHPPAQGLRNHAP